MRMKLTSFLQNKKRKIFAIKPWELTSIRRWQQMITLEILTLENHSKHFLTLKNQLLILVTNEWVDKVWRIGLKRKKAGQEQTIHCSNQRKKNTTPMLSNTLMTITQAPFQFKNFKKSSKSRVINRPLKKSKSFFLMQRQQHLDS